MPGRFLLRTPAPGRRAKFVPLIGFVAWAATIGSWCSAPPARAVVLIEDGFDDADRDNDGFTDDGLNNPVASPTGISWFAINGKSTAGTQRPILSIIDEVESGFTGSGNALKITTVGANSEWIGRFPTRLTLGSNVGDKLQFSFDIRILDLLLPTANQLRFGVYQDSDNQFGMAATNSDGTPTVWGETDGWFDVADNPSVLVGTRDDYGVLARVHAGTNAVTDSDFRLLEELNTAGSILGGTGDNDFVAKPDGLDGRAAFADMPVLLSDTRRITLTIERATVNATGNDIRHTLDIDGVSFGEQDSNGTGSPNFDSRDSFDYVVFSMTVGINSYAFDNFLIEQIDGPIVPSDNADFNGDALVDGADFLIWQRNNGTGAGASLANGDATGNGAVDAADLAVWQSQFGTPGGAAAAIGAVPEPSAAALLAACGLTLRRWRAAARRRA